MAKPAQPRKKVARKRCKIELGAKLIAELDKACKLHRMSRSKIVEDALRKYYARFEKEELSKA